MNDTTTMTLEGKTASNERFCVIAAVSPQIMQCKLASYYPAASSVEAATTQSRRHVSGKRRRRCRRGSAVSKRDYNLTMK